VLSYGVRTEADCYQHQSLLPIVQLNMQEHGVSASTRVNSVALSLLRLFPPTPRAHEAFVALEQNHGTCTATFPAEVGNLAKLFEIAIGSRLGFANGCQAFALRRVRTSPVAGQIGLVRLHTGNIGINIVSVLGLGVSTNLLIGGPSFLSQQIGTKIC
jgi:hypothetical protein